MLALTKPQYFIPVHGEERHIYNHADLAYDIGMKPQDVFIPEIGWAIELRPEKRQVRRNRGVRHRHDRRPGDRRCRQRRAEGSTGPLAGRPVHRCGDAVARKTPSSFPVRRSSPAGSSI
ncbi:MAG: MBL fold metallo-hydrolase RNA specificity domain-containing protein [Christensenellaceae bacterium]